MLSLTKALLALRRAEPGLHAGSYRSLEAPEGCFAYERGDGEERFVVALNFT
ncbi:MAG: DUF3459 domain-containing protein, partial [Actinobacteria bacterium]|nr:DUF3459 domain-containing protein [Actinomycetota bacterium]NIS30689.1 DUF3459 domain-containing protein [Actinomycetota bacterium]NIU21472.1 DUF3459 domain-containing protein [Actinomycetota bacterium]NIU65899.1 DUF3459 domain-containing protein [Actinomycetota bacterium]NIW27690.1 DUF3459 domain-containing protein [Actinomycetota bacterium]